MFKCSWRISSWNIFRQCRIHFWVFDADSDLRGGTWYVGNNFLLWYSEDFYMGSPILPMLVAKCHKVHCCQTQNMNWRWLESVSNACAFLTVLMMHYCLMLFKYDVQRMYGLDDKMLFSTQIASMNMVRSKASVVFWWWIVFNLFGGMCSWMFLDWFSL